MSSFRVLQSVKRLCLQTWLCLYPLSALCTGRPEGHYSVFVGGWGQCPGGAGTGTSPCGGDAVGRAPEVTEQPAAQCARQEQAEGASPGSRRRGAPCRGLSVCLRAPAWGHCHQRRGLRQCWAHARSEPIGHRGRLWTGRASYKQNQEIDKVT